MLAPARGRGVDVGCGNGTAVAELAGLGFDAEGADLSQAMVDTARERHPGRVFHRADALGLPYPDGSLHWYRAERVFIHLADPAAALAEARRVLAAGGRIVLADQDFESTVIDSADPALTRAIITAFADRLPSGRAGSRVPALLAEAGFDDVVVGAVPLVFRSLRDLAPLFLRPALTAALAAGAVTSAQAERWERDLRDRAGRDRLLVAATMFVTAARRSGAASGGAERP
jgi:SAM-dependent methyltransferase